MSEALTQSATTITVGQALPRRDAADKVRGQAIFAADVQLPRMLVGKFLPSPHAHAEILAIDTHQAEALPGVRAVITRADIPQVDTYDPASRFHAFLARRFAVFAGQPIAAVAADDLATAEAALELIQVEYRLLPPVLDPEQAILPDSPAVSREHSSAAQDESPNVAGRFVFEHGDLATAWAESSVACEHTYTVPVVHQGYIEPHAVTAFWDRKDHVTVWACVQSPFGARDLIANTLGIAPSNITLNTTEIGGGFGGKDLGIFSPLAVLLARKAQQPVQLALTRRDELTGANPAPHTVVHIKTGARSDGTLTACEGRVLTDIGACTSYWDAADSIPWMLLVNYKFQAWHVEGLAVLTNKASLGSYRAPLAVNAAFAIESQLDEIARRLRLDPLALRLQNVVAEGDLLPNQKPQSQVGSKKVLTALSAHSAWTDPLPPRQSEDGWLHGRGVALGSWGSGMWPAAAFAKLDADGKIRIVLGTVDLSGSYTSLAQIAAEALGVSVQRILLSKASTEHAPYAPVSGGSGTIYSMGAAVKEAALDLRAKLLKYATQELQVAEADVAINDQGVCVTAQPKRVVSFQKLYELGTDIFLAKYPPLIGQGAVRPQKRAPCFAATIAQVAVDPETGQVFVAKLITAQDVGKAINPLSVEGQIQGGAVQAAGIALWEQVMYDEHGLVRNPSLSDYHMPTAMDVPMIETILVQAPGGDGPYGAKGVGEPPIISPVAAIANAVANAIGMRVCDLPITPERVWRALGSQSGTR